jgi:uncharacterized membrane protein YphA (DoxX/SURF4 family)
MSFNPTPYRSLSLWAIVALVCLRLVIGWHFYKEGVAKVREGNFSSTGFLNAAKGPLADGFHAMIPDYDGKVRLNAEAMASAMDSYAQLVQTKYGFDEAQVQRSKVLVAGLKEKLNGVYGQWSSQIREYQLGFERMAKMADDPKRWEVESLSQQREEIESKWRGLVKPALAEIDKVTSALEEQLQGLATPDQRTRVGEIGFRGLDSGPLSVKAVDKIIPIFDMSVGILLILGLCTQVAAWAAGLFLASVVLTQFPGYPGAQPTYYQAIEMVGCFVLAFTDAGRYAGLDFIPWAWWRSRAKPAAKAA